MSICSYVLSLIHIFYYENTGFRYYHGTTYDEVRSTVRECRDAGVELWQADFEVTPQDVGLRQYFQLEQW